MSDQIIAGLVAAVVSLLVSIATYLAAERKLRNERMSAERAIAQKFAEELMRQRLRLYPKAFIVTENIGKGDPENAKLQENYRSTLEELRAWKVGEVECIISADAEKCYEKLIEKMKRNPERNNKYSREQLNKLFTLRQNFRAALRRDLGLIHASSKLYLHSDSLLGGTNTTQGQDRI